MVVVVYSLNKNSLQYVFIFCAPFLFAEEKNVHKSSTGIAFYSVDGLSVLVAGYETRVGDFIEFRKKTDHEEIEVHFKQTEDHPVVGVSFYEAQKYCEWLTEIDQKKMILAKDQRYRLPMNKEWSLAGGLLGGNSLLALHDRNIYNQKLYPWGMEWPPPAKAGNVASKSIKGYDDNFEHTSPVGSFNKNKFGLYDFSGNVWEWCTDVNSDQEPTATLRGGSWAYFRKKTLKTDYRYLVSKNLKSTTVGFRMVLEGNDLLNKGTETNEIELSNQRERLLRNKKVEKNSENPK